MLFILSQLEKLTFFERIQMLKFLKLTEFSSYYKLSVQMQSHFCRTDSILGDPGADRGGKGKSKRAKENGEEEKHTFFFFVAIFFRPF